MNHRNPSPISRPIWEYKLLHSRLPGQLRSLGEGLGDIEVSAPWADQLKEWEAVSNKLGLEGWELVWTAKEEWGFVGMFKRLAGY